MLNRGLLLKVQNTQVKLTWMGSTIKKGQTLPVTPEAIKGISWNGTLLDTISPDLPPLIFRYYSARVSQDKPLLKVDLDYKPKLCWGAEYNWHSPLGIAINPTTGHIFIASTYLSAVCVCDHWWQIFTLVWRKPWPQKSKTRSTPRTNILDVRSPKQFIGLK